MKQFVSSPKALGATLKRQRKTKQLTQAQAGAPFKIDQGTISDAEQGSEGTKLGTLFRILAALDLEMVIRSKDEDFDTHRE